MTEALIGLLIILLLILLGIGAIGAILFGNDKK